MIVSSLVGTKRFVALIFSAALLAAGFYFSIYRNYYRWDTPLISQVYSVPNPRVGVLVDLKNQKTISSLQEYFISNNEPEIFVYSYSPALYFLLNKSNPTRFDYLRPGVITTAVTNEVIASLSKRNILTVISDSNLEENQNGISSYILSHFTPVFKVFDYTVLKRNP